MGSNKTNSNSITSILVEKLNNQKSGFRYNMLKKWNITKDGKTLELDDEIKFEDGTNKQTPIDEMGNKKVDIIGRSGNKIKVLIEIKAGNRERLQKSQKKNGEYDLTAQAHSDIKFVYIIPDEYEDRDLIPSRMEICKWSEIYIIALEFDNTGFAEQIKFFVENNYSNPILSKGDVIMYLNPNIIEHVLSLNSKITYLMEKFVATHDYLIEKCASRDMTDNLAYRYDILIQDKRRIPGIEKIEYVWIGLGSPEEDKNCSFFISFGLKDEKPISLKDNENPASPDYYQEAWKDGPGHNYDFPIKTKDGNPPMFLFDTDAETQQRNFDELLEYNILKVLDYLKLKK